MSNITTMIPTPSASGFAMPACGHVFEGAFGTGARTVVVDGYAIDRARVDAVKTGLAQGSTPGTSAWRPPDC